ncbi:hypothetical protein [Paenarthrobacter aurescens]|jgi:hypothetical protein|uniref:Alkylmercury lyase n=1 Tax=Paenarthrobacter aurescens (strain TC1) TaxID=290340 RepID=A1RDB5_PAEAT|nr:hypothetical protein [Paenarthrobacter aurescens]ABM10614.1 conserved hypothetical protein [Paenarthrobacter aurescens TC1]
MNAELLTIPGCPHAAPALELFSTALELEGIGVSVTVREISTEDQATAQSFRGSPTFTLNGADLFPSDADPAVTCRVYSTPDGLSGQPTLDTLRRNLQSRLPSANRSA